MEYEKQIWLKTLSSLVQMLQNHTTTIDLRNEAWVTGKIVTADLFMNVEMENATFCDPRGKEHFHKSFFVNARNIRYIHIPSDLPVEDMIKQQTEKPKMGGYRRKTFRNIKAQNYQQSILKNIGEPSTSQT